MTKTMARYPVIVSATEKLLNYVTGVEAAVHERLQNVRSLKPDDPFTLCSYREKQWANTVHQVYGLRGWEDPDTECVTDIHRVSLGVGYEVDDIYEAMYDRLVTIKKNIRVIAKSVIGNFSDPDVVYDCPYRRGFARCVLHPAMVIRLKENWYLAAALQNRPKAEQLKNFQRHKLKEYARVDRGEMNDTLKMRIAVRGTVPLLRRNDTTTMMESWRRSANPSEFGIIPVDENVATIEALDQMDVPTQQVEDATTPSNIAILALPILLNLVPIALFAEVSTHVMLAYTLLSDVLTVFPMGIKGVELLLIHRTRYRSVVVRITSPSPLTPLNELGERTSEPAAAEIWAAECRISNNVRRIGWAFLVTSITFLFVGVFLECWAVWYAKRTKRKWVQMIRIDSREGSSASGASAASSGGVRDTFENSLEDYSTSLLPAES